jgi:hypothetical protein
MLLRLPFDLPTTTSLARTSATPTRLLNLDSEILRRATTGNRDDLNLLLFPSSRRATRSTSLRSNEYSNITETALLLLLVLLILLVRLHQLPSVSRSGTALFLVVTAHTIGAEFSTATDWVTGSTGDEGFFHYFGEDGGEERSGEDRLGVNEGYGG